MLLFRICLFWLLISSHVVGGAALFHRWFPRESPWFGFLVPSLALVLVLNFLEHAVAFQLLHGTTVPPPYSLFPPHTIGHYYAFLHYGISVLIRLFGIDVGTGCNLGAALISACGRARRCEEGYKQDW